VNRQLGPTDVKRLNRSWRRLTTARLSVLLESIGQPFNLGSIIRTAAAFGAAEVWLCGDCADPDHPSARKTALGTGRHLTFRRVRDVSEAATELRGRGSRLVAVELAAGAVPLHAADLAGDCCLAFGNEDRAAAAAVTYIPQAGRIGSLNVAAAVAVALAEARRREWARSDQGGAGDDRTGPA
jgi:tRNA (guanosine-2'-O-)-methyltransferase